MTHPTLERRPFTVQELRWETPTVFTLALVPEAGSMMFPFAAGQWAYLHLLEPDGTSWARAAFSVATAPEESLSGCELAIKVYGDFTKRAAQLVPGDRVALQGPFGVFTLPTGSEPLILFAAGIGITPLRSMARSVAETDPTRPITLFYSNRTIEETAYYEELFSLGERCAGFQPVFLLTGETPNEWQGERGRLSAEMVKRHVPSLERGTFLMCGPAGFMQTVRTALDGLGVDTKTRLKQELFG